MERKKLVAYFSASGVTARAARALAEAAGADLFEIRPQIPYTQEDLNWMNPASRSSLEMHDPAFRPALSDADAHVEAYDVIFLGYPIWWDRAPSVIDAFLERCDFSGKVLVLFATSGGSGLGKSAVALRRRVSDAADLREGLLLNGRLSQPALKSWIRSLGL